MYNDLDVQLLNVAATSRVNVRVNLILLPGQLGGGRVSPGFPCCAFFSRCGSGSSFIEVTVLLLEARRGVRYY